MDSFRQWTCPTLCGCVIEEKTTWVDLDGDGVMDNFTFNGPVRILSQCQEHAAFIDLVSLNAELRHYHGTAYTPDTHGCRCKIAYYTDDRDASDENGQTVLHPVEHPIHTKRCKVHQQHTDTHAHHAAVFAENRAKNRAVIIVSEQLGITPEDVPYTMNKQRDVVIDHSKLGVDPATIALWMAVAPGKG